MLVPIGKKTRMKLLASLKLTASSPLKTTVNQEIWGRLTVCFFSHVSHDIPYPMVFLAGEFLPRHLGGPIPQLR